MQLMNRFKPTKNLRCNGGNRNFRFFPSSSLNIEMTATNERFAIYDVRLNAVKQHRLLGCRWEQLCEQYLPVKSEDSIWRFSSEAKVGQPLQGWKLHLSAIVTEACDLFEKIAPFLISEDVQFKAPKTLDELLKINCGLEYGYSQVGKFITVYPATSDCAVRLARELHELTSGFASIAVPFDEQYLPDSSVFYRYGAFVTIELTDETGEKISAVKTPSGKFVPDNRLEAIPEWISNPFQTNGENVGNSFKHTPLESTYKVFRAITQRGKGGTYQAIDFSRDEPCFCIVKEGRQHGEIGWDGQGGRHLVKNEFVVLTALEKNNSDAPRVFASFEIDRNYYLVMEYVEGKSLFTLMKLRRRRFPIRQVVEFAVGIAGVIGKIHQAGWVWNDCKPANLIVMRDKSLRPVDFEGAYPVGQSAPFDWQTKAFSKSASDQAKNDGKSNDLYALGAVVYFLLTGKLFAADASTAITKLRRNVPNRLIETIEKLLSGAVSDGAEIVRELKEIHSLIRFKGSYIV